MNDRGCVQSAMMPSVDFSSESRLARCVCERSLKVAEHASIEPSDAAEQQTPEAGSNRGDARSGARQGADRAEPALAATRGWRGGD